MHLVRDHSAGARAVSVPCLQCGHMHRLCESVIDRHGPAFMAYYCPACAPGLQAPVQRCPDPHCLECHREYQA